MADGKKTGAQKGGKAPTEKAGAAGSAAKGPAPKKAERKTEPKKAAGKPASTTAKTLIVPADKRHHAIIGVTRSGLRGPVHAVHIARSGGARTELSFPEDYNFGEVVAQVSREMNDESSWALVVGSGNMGRIIKALLADGRGLGVHGGKGGECTGQTGNPSPRGIFDTPGLSVPKNDGGFPMAFKAIACPATKVNAEYTVGPLGFFLQSTQAVLFQVPPNCNAWDSPAKANVVLGSGPQLYFEPNAISGARTITVPSTATVYVATPRIRVNVTFTPTTQLGACVISLCVSGAVTGTGVPQLGFWNSPGNTSTPSTFTVSIS